MRRRRADMLLPRIVRPHRAEAAVREGPGLRDVLRPPAEADTPAPAAGADAYLTIRRAPLTFL